MASVVARLYLGRAATYIKKGAHKSGGGDLITSAFTSGDAKKQKTKRNTGKAPLVLHVT